MSARRSLFALWPPLARSSVDKRPTTACNVTGRRPVCPEAAARTGEVVMSLAATQVPSLGRLLLFLAVAALSLAIGTGGQAAMTDYQKQQITQYLHSPKTKMEAGVFDGRSFDPSVAVSDARSYMNDFIKTMNQAVNAWNKLTSDAARSPEGQALLKELNEKLDFAKAMREAFPAFEANQGNQPASEDSASNVGGTSQPEAAGGGMTDYQKELLTRYLDSQAMRRDLSIFDGKNLVAGVPFPSFEQYYQGYMKDLKQAASTWERQIPYSSKGTPDGQALQKRLNEAIAWGNAMSAQYASAKSQYQQQQQAAQAAQQQDADAAESQKEFHKQQCLAFQQEAMRPLARDPMTRLINQRLHQNSALGSVEEIDRHRQVAGDVLAVCQSVDHSVLASEPCFYVLGRPYEDPVNWCDAAARADELIQAASLNHARRTIASVGSSTIQSPSEFHERDGWLTFEGPVTFNNDLFFSARGREAVMESVHEVLQAAGIDDAEDALWGEQKERLAALRSEVEKTAGSWKSPPKEADNYSTELAAQQIKDWHGDAEVLDAYLNRESWKIHKNALGIPDRRTLPGVVIFKLAQDPYCQLRSYTLTEQYFGDGNFQQANGVRIGYVRFQDCP